MIGSPPGFKVGRVSAVSTLAAVAVATAAKVGTAETRPTPKFGGLTCLLDLLKAPIRLQEAEPRPPGKVTEMRRNPLYKPKWVRDFGVIEGKLKILILRLASAKTPVRHTLRTFIVGKWRVGALGH